VVSEDSFPPGCLIPSLPLSPEDPNSPPLPETFGALFVVPLSLPLLLLYKPIPPMVSIGKSLSTFLNVLSYTIGLYLTLLGGRIGCYEFKEAPPLLWIF
jgi:hypothetical protein